MSDEAGPSSAIGHSVPLPTSSTTDSSVSVAPTKAAASTVDVGKRVLDERDAAASVKQGRKRPKAETKRDTGLTNHEAAMDEAANAEHEAVKEDAQTQPWLTASEPGPSRLPLEERKEAKLGELEPPLANATLADEVVEGGAGTTVEFGGKEDKTGAEEGIQDAASTSNRKKSVKSRGKGKSKAAAGADPSNRPPAPTEILFSSPWPATQSDLFPDASSGIAALHVWSKAAGFNVRKRSSYLEEWRKSPFVYLECKKSGVYKNRHGVTEETRRRNRTIERMSCPFRAKVQLKDAEKENATWKLSVNCADHNHLPFETMQGPMAIGSASAGGVKGGSAGQAALESLPGEQGAEQGDHAPGGQDATNQNQATEAIAFLAAQALQSQPSTATRDAEAQAGFVQQEHQEAEEEGDGQEGMREQEAREEAEAIATLDSSGAAEVHMTGYEEDEDGQTNEDVEALDPAPEA
ncbi:FAR1 DNA binding domain [Ceraceosorus bombacis]|uniref:FAR1 DNA binding domain n=1 Tax=Ceraceosorus bombacis TaxID=401625 RepID=A0A0P1B990_9BASI|nr:FAR1 DNA binding domain [Ceraceosorus bombacis]